MQLEGRHADRTPGPGNGRGPGGPRDELGREAVRAWFSRAIRSYSCLRTFIFSEVTVTCESEHGRLQSRANMEGAHTWNVNIVCVGRALCVLYAGSAFMIEYILPSRILFSRSIARLRSASIWRGRSAVGLSESRSWQASGAEGGGGGRREAARRGHGHLHALRIVLHVRVGERWPHVNRGLHRLELHQVDGLLTLREKRGEQGQGKGG